MPIYAPYVIERSSRGERSYDIFSRLLMDRIVFLGNPINDDVANVIIAQLLFLQADNPEKDIYLYINSPGGSVYAGLAIFDTIQFLSCPVNTYCMGIAASMGSFLLAAGTKGKRYVLPNSQVMLHQPLIGGVLYQSVGTWFIETFAYQDAYESFRALFDRHGFLAILVVALIAVAVHSVLIAWADRKGRFTLRVERISTVFQMNHSSDSGPARPKSRRIHTNTRGQSPCSSRSRSRCRDMLRGSRAPRGYTSTLSTSSASIVKSTPFAFSPGLPRSRCARRRSSAPLETTW